MGLPFTKIQLLRATGSGPHAVVATSIMLRGARFIIAKSDLALVFERSS
jgi:hypothetical protein